MSLRDASTRRQRLQRHCTNFLLLLCAVSPFGALSQEFSSAGPYATDSYQKAVTFTTSAGDTRHATVTVTYPANGAGPCPLVLAFNGFECQASWYVDSITRIVSWGYVVMQYDLPVVTELLHGDAEEATYVQPLLDWLATELAPGSASPAAGKADFDNKAVLGHSRGGKLATLQYATRDDIRTAVLFDPVDCFIPGPNYPSAVAAMAGVDANCGATLPPLIRSDKTAAVIGAGIVAPGVPCNPPKYNYNTFANVLGAGTWKIMINQAGHMQFASSDSLAYRTIDLACWSGNIGTETVYQDARTIAVAWLESTFRPLESVARLQGFGDWLEVQMTNGDLSFETLVAERSGMPRYVDVA